MGMGDDGDRVDSSLPEHVRALLRDAFEAAPFEFWARDLDGVCVVANAETRRLDNVSEAKVDEARVPPDVIAAWQENNRRAYAGEVIRNSFDYGIGDHRRNLQCYIVPLRVGGVIRGILGFNIDVTEHTRTEEALRESERRLSEFMRVGHMGWVDWDLTTDTVRWSPETYRLLGYDPEGTFSPTSATMLAMIPADELESVQAGLNAAIAGGAPFDLVHRMIRRDGDVIHVHAHTEVTRDRDGNPLRMLGTLVDVTERARAEAELREVDRRRSEFLAVLSHELRNPLAAITTSVRFLEQAAIADEQVRRAVAVVQRQTRQLSRLVDDLLDMTRVRSGKITLQRTPVELGELVHSALADHRDLLRGRTVVTRVPDRPVWTSGDKTRLAQILSNLLTNAAKFTPAGGEIAVALAVADGHAVLDVADTGVGIDSESLARLFVPFVQADRSLDRSRHGLGLGLALIKTLVELHGGRVHVHSAGPGTGARFTVTLPVIDVHPREVPQATVAAPIPRSVLLVEDDADVAEWLSLVLALSGHCVTLAGDGASALAKAREVNPDVLVCDIGLPGALDGYAVARALQQDAALAHIYRVALSGFTQPDDQARAREAGFDAHFAKPPDLDALEHLLSQLPRRP